MLVKATIRALASRFFALALLCCASLAWTPLAMAQHSSALCPVQSGNVANGGSVVIEVTDCVDFFGPGVGPVQGAPANGTAVLSELFTPPSTYQAFVTYTHNGNSATSDTFTFKDEYGQDVQVNITIAAPTSSIVVSPASISLQTGVSFSTTLSSTGGTAPYTYTLNSGTVPAGMTLSGASLSGTPTQRGPFSFTVRSQDSLGAFALKTYGGTIADPVLGVNPASTTIYQGVASTLQFAGTGGTPTYSFALNSGTLPPGTSLQANGQLTGTPTTTGTYNFSLLVNDSTTDPACPGCDFFAVVPVSVNVVSAPSLSINDVTLAEGNAGTINAVFTVSLSAPAPAGGVTFDIATANGTATSGSDYVNNALTGQTIPAGSSTYTFTVVVNGDLLNEPDETYFANVTNVVGAIVSDGQGQGTITNDDAVPSLGINDVTVTEGDSGTTTATFTVLLSAASGQTVTVNYATANGTATAPGDYVSTSGTLTFLSGATSQTISVTVNGDTGVEPDETFTVGLSAASNATLADASGLGTITNDDVPLTLTPAALPGGNIGVAYSQTLAATGGVPPYTYTFSVTSGTLPTGVTLASNGVLSGTPTAGGTFPFTATVSDGVSTDDENFTIVIAPATITLPATTLAGGNVGAAYSATVTAATGGIAPYTYAVTAGALPPGLTLNPGSGTISGTPTAGGTFNFTLTATDSSTGSGPYSGTQGYAITIIDVPPVANAVSVTVAHGSGANPVTLNITGGAPTSVAIGTAPANGTAIASGTSITYQPNAGYGGPDSFTYTATNGGGTSAPATVTVTVSAPTIAIAPPTLTNANISAAYSATLTPSGGAAPYTVAVTAGALPAGLTLSSAGALTGTPTAAGTFNFTVTATDSSTGTGPFFGSQSYALVVNAPTIALTPASLPNPGVGVAYSETVAASGGTSPYTYSVTAGALPAGLTIASNGTISGTPTAGGTFNFTVTAVDSSTGSGPFSGSRAYALVVGAPTLAMTPAPGTLTLPYATSYSQTFVGSGGVAPYSYSLSAGALPVGVSFSSGGVLSGTPTTPGSYPISVRVTDSSTGSGPYTLTQNYVLSVPSPTITLAPSTLTGGTVGVSLGSQTITASGGAGPYTFALTTGSLPPGTSFTSGGVFSGTPTAAGTFNFTIVATDGNAQTGSQAYTVTVVAPTITFTPATLAGGTIGVAYSQAVTASGGTGPYTYAVTSGALPTGVSLSASGALAGTPTAAGSFNFTVTATDSFSQTGSQAYTVTVVAPTITLTPPTLAGGTVGVAYSQAVTASGGTGPYSYAVTAGTLPAGVSLSAGGTLAGTPTAAGSSNFTVTATDSFSQTGSQAYTVVVSLATITLTPATLPNGTAGVAYSQAITAGGGTGPYTYAVTAGALPAGVSLAADGTLAGTPTVAGSFNFSVTATDSFSQTGTRAYALTLAAPTLTLAPATLPNGTVGTAYTQTFTTTGGTAPYAHAVTAGSLPAGLTLAANGSLTGTPTTAATSNFTVTTTDALGFSTSGTFSVVVSEAIPVAVADNATTLAGTAVVIAVSANDTGVITSITTAAAPGHGTATVTGMDITYTPAAGYSGTDTFTYTATGPGGTSAPATVTVVVNPVPVAPNFSVTTTPATPVQVTLTAGATGGPFTGADIVSMTPAAAGSASIATSGANQVLTFTPASGFAGPVTVRYTLDNAFATSNEGVVSILVEDRPDPSKDAEVQGTIDAQAESTHRFATSQISNFQQRMEQLHGGGDTSGVQNGIGFSVDRPCIEPLVGRTVDPCSTQPGAGGTGLSAADDARGARANNSHGPMGIWTGGMIRSGSEDGRDGNADISFETDGLSTGIDYRVNEALVIGGGFGYGRDDNAIGRNGTRVDGSARTIALYASYHPGEMFFLDSLVGYQQLDFDTRRYIAANGGLVNGQRDGDQWFASFSIGADIVRDQLLLTPYARFDFEQATLDAYTESGDPIYALHYESMDVDNSSGSLGLRMDHQTIVSWGRFTPQVRIEYQHDFGGRSDAFVRYADLFGGPRYGLLATDFDRNRFMLGLGALFDLDSGWGWRLEYQGQVGNDGGEDHGVMVNVQKQF